MRCVPAACGWRGTPEAGNGHRRGGHGEGLRRSRGEAAGVELGTSPVDRISSERGNRPVLPSPPCSQHAGRAGSSSADGTGRGGAPVVVRGRESRPHGEGGQQVSSGRAGMTRRTPVNTGDRRLARSGLSGRVLEIQAKLHRWASDDPDRRFDDLFNLVADPAFLMMAWDRVRGNKGATHGRRRRADRRLRRSGPAGTGSWPTCGTQLKARRFRPLPVRERMIPKPGGKLRRLGIPTVADRVVQASLKLVLEPIFEADFVPCSYGFRPSAACPGRDRREPLPGVHARMSGCWRATSRRASTRFRTPALMDRVRARIGDKRVLALVKAFLKAGHPRRGRRCQGHHHRHPAGWGHHAPNAMGNLHDCHPPCRRLRCRARCRGCAREPGCGAGW